MSTNVMRLRGHLRLFQVALTLLAVFASWLIAGPASAQTGGGCGKDTDCKGDRICDAGKCVAAPPPAAAPLACQADKDCPGDSICEASVCVAPNKSPAAPVAGAPVAPAGTPPPVAPPAMAPPPAAPGAVAPAAAPPTAQLPGSPAAATTVPVASAASSAAPGAAEQVTASTTPAPSGKYELGATLDLVSPTGDYDTAFDAGFGLSVHGAMRVKETPSFSLLVGAAIDYGSVSADGDSASTFAVLGQGRIVHSMDAIGVFGFLGLGLGHISVSSGFGDQSTTKIGAFEIGGGGSYRVSPGFSLTAALAYESIPTDDDSVTQITIRAGVVFVR